MTSIISRVSKRTLTNSVSSLTSCYNSRVNVSMSIIAKFGGYTQKSRVCLSYVIVCWKNMSL